MKIGIDLGGSHIGIGVIENSEIIEKIEKPFTDEEKTKIIEVIENFIVEKVQEYEKKYDIESIGIAIPGSAKDGVILKTINLGINNYDLGKSLNEKLNKTIKIRNDCKCSCIAEYNNIIKKQPSLENANMIFLGIGTGIGGGVIYNGNLLEGHYFEGYEIGHMIINENGIPCRCGKNGCFERYGSILEYKNKVKQRLNLSQDLHGDPLREILENRKEEIKDINEKYILDLCIGISNLINIFEPDIIVLGGGFSNFGYMFIERIKEKLLNSNLLFNKRENIDIRIAELGNDAGIIGATF